MTGARTMAHDKTLFDDNLTAAARPEVGHG